MNKKVLIAVLGTGAVLGLILIFSKFNIDMNVKNPENEAVLQTQDNSMASMHGQGSIDESMFNSLVGRVAPDFTLESYNGEKVTLSSLKGKNVILFFNEGLMCYPSCWNQIVAFGKDAKLREKAVVLNITVDSKNDWKQAVDKMSELSLATVLFDGNRAVSQKYGVLTLPSSMHKGQFPGHSYVIIDKEGIVKFVRDDVQMAVRNSEISSELDKI